MKYLVDVGDRRMEVVVTGESLLVDGQSVVAHLTEIEGTPVRLVTVGGAQHRVIAQRGEGRGRYILSIEGWRFPVEAVDERTRAIRDLSGPAGGALGPASLRAPMPGLVVRISVAVGEMVAAGQALVAVEAMKMENELRSPIAGKVTAIRATVGTAVEKGVVLVEIEPVDGSGASSQRLD